MKNRLVILIAINLLVFNLGLFGLAHKKSAKTLPVVTSPLPPIMHPKVPVETPPPNYTLETPVPSFMQYEELVAQLHKWADDAPRLSEMGSYGKSINGKDLIYFRVHNRKKVDRPIVLVTAAIHGNESWSTGIVMGYIGTLLDQYGDDEQITQIVDSVDIYFVPIVSPATYPDRREVNGIDPNRDFPTQKDPGKSSIQAIQALCEFFVSLRPQAVLSGHTWGRLYLQPYGDSMKDPPHQSDYQRIGGKMVELSHYTLQKASQIYRRPILGTEIDWYYRHGAFAMVAEFGAHQHPPTASEILSEFNRTFQAFLYFLEEAPKIRIEWSAGWAHPLAA